ncbi:hypothetical protein HDU86_007181 [Geranomyces michiganensis]|nr:hypothetical protein HDU86_007181 [Geranomyces michiganensis]
MYLHDHRHRVDNRTTGHVSENNGEEDEELDILRAMMAEDDASDDEGPLWPEDFSAESEDVVGSGLSDESDTPSEPPASAPPPRDNDSSAADSLADRILAAASKRPRGRSAVPKAKKLRETGEGTAQPARKTVRGVTSYGLYAKKARSEVKRRHPTLLGPEVTKLLKRQWLDLPDRDREVFENAALEHNAALHTEAADDVNQGDVGVAEHDDVLAGPSASRSTESRTRPATVFSTINSENDSDISLSPPRRPAKRNAGASLLLVDSESETGNEDIVSLTPTEAPRSEALPAITARGRADNSDETTDEDVRFTIPLKPLSSFAGGTSVGNTQPRSQTRGGRSLFCSSSDTE